MAIPQPNEGYVIGLLNDLETQVPELGRKLAEAQTQRAASDEELSRHIGRRDASDAAHQEASQQAASIASHIQANNKRLVVLHQEIDAFSRRAAQLAQRIETAAGPEIRSLRRERGGVLADIEDREQETAALNAAAPSLRRQAQATEKEVLACRDRAHEVARTLDDLQKRLPGPKVYTNLVEHALARAHCRLFLDRLPQPWERDMLRSAKLMHQLHVALRAGRYRLDTNSDVIGGRATATSETIAGAIAVGASDLAREIFVQATDQGLFFHHIFNVYRTWCFGLYIGGERRQLAALLRLHQHAEGMRGAYARAFIGLLAQQPRRTEEGLRELVRCEWEMWQDPHRVRGMGVVNVGALAIMRLARERGMLVSVAGQTIPNALLFASLPQRPPPTR